MKRISAPRMRTDRVLASWVLSIVAIALAVTTSPAAAKVIADCPSAHVPYSIDTVLLDLLLDPRAEAVLDTEGLLKPLPPFVRNTTPPSFAALLTPRRMLTASEGHVLPGGPERLAAVNRQLAAIPITEEAALRRCARYDHVPPTLLIPTRHPAILVFEKINGFRDGPSVEAAHKAFADMAARRHWSMTFSANGDTFNRSQLKQYDAVVWNNVSGDALTVPQEKAFQAYLAGGGGFAGVHGAGGDPVYVWDWYPDVVIGARFLGHPMAPQFQSARVVVEGTGAGITAHLPKDWTMTEEWYSFVSSPRSRGAHILVHVEESSYSPGARLTMGDHPIAWSHCIGNGRAFYTAIGHRPESYVEPNSVNLLEQGVAWAAGAGDTTCRNGHEIPARREPSSSN